MEDHLHSKGICSICHEKMTTVSAEAGQGKALYVCEKCLESAKENFIFLCMHCGSVFIRPKSLVLARLKDPGLRKAYEACRDLQIIQGIDLCAECDPDRVVELALTAGCGRRGGHC